MPTNVFCSGGQEIALGMLLQATTPGTMTLHLYQNNVFPSLSSTSATFTECSFTGYVDAVLTRSDWSDPATLGGSATSSFPVVTFTNTGTLPTVFYGFYVTDVSGNLIYAGRFDQTETLEPSSSYTYTPVFTLT